MKKFTCSLVLALLIPFLASGQGSRRVLFLGNSYTAVNNLPQLTADLALSAGDTLVFGSNTPGGYTFQLHSTDAVSLQQIMTGTWDHVVLQEQSQLPSFPDGQVQTQCFPYARYLDSLVDLYQPGGRTMFYMTWGRKNGDAQNCPNWPPVCTYAGMDSLLRLRYLAMAGMNDAAVSPVGAVWRYLRVHVPSIELYAADESHPSPAGSYAAACAFYAAIFHKDPAVLTYNYSLAAQDAIAIRQAASLVVYDSLDFWTGEYHPFPTAGTIWNTVGYNMFSLDQYEFRFGVFGDTTINNLVYTRVYNLLDTSLISSTATFFGGIREEGKRVYLQMPGMDETLLYDFSLAVGDTAWYDIGGALCGNAVTWWPQTSHYLTVTAIDSILLMNNEYRKRWHLQGNVIGDEWAEGVGSISWFGLFNPLISDIALCGDDYDFACFRQNYQTLYLNNMNCADCFCDLILGDAPPGEAGSVVILTDPSRQAVLIKGVPLHLVYNVSFLNMAGQRLPGRENLTGDQAVPVSVLPPGTYVVQVTDQSGHSLGSGKITLK